MQSRGEGDQLPNDVLIFVALFVLFLPVLFMIMIKINNMYIDAIKGRLSPTIYRWIGIVPLVVVLVMIILVVLKLLLDQPDMISAQFIPK